MVEIKRISKEEMLKGLKDGSIAAGNTIDELMGVRRNTRLQADEYEDKHQEEDEE